MSLIDRLCNMFPSRVFDIRKPDPTDPQGDHVLYLRRITLLEVMGMRLCLHLIHRSDEDPDPHDHPWDFITVVLRRPYRDEQWTWDGKRRGGPIYQRMRRFLPTYRRAEHLHRVIIDPDQRVPTISLVLMLKQRRRWFFVTSSGPVYWRTYLNIPAETAGGARLRED